MNEKLIDSVSKIIYEKKGFHLLALDLRGVSSVTDYILVAEGNVNRHLKAIANAILQEVEEKPYRVEGLDESDWIVIDYLDLMVHLFLPNVRGKYQLEKLWPEAKLIDLKLEMLEKEKIL